MAKIRPASRIPRRFAQASSTMSPTEISTWYGSRPRITATMACTPPDTLTATVRT